MNHRRLSILIVVTLLIFVSQFIPSSATGSVSAGSRCNTAGFIADVTVPDGASFQPGAAFVKTWRLKNTGNCTWTRAYSLAYVSGDPLGATFSMAMPFVSPSQQVNLSLDMNAPTTPGHYRGYWMLKDAHGVKFGLGLYGSSPFWVDINVGSSGLPSPTPPPPTTTGLNLQGTVRLNGSGLGGVRIYRSYAGYSGVLVATSAADGTYKADFMPIPGDETVTVWAELTGYKFDPVSVNWRHYHSVENKVQDFTAISSPPPPPPAGGTGFDFVTQVCAARWVSGAGQLPCPSTDGDNRGFVLSLDHPMLENGTTDGAPGLLVFPQNIYNGYIQGFYPEYTVQTGDQFQASVGCAYGSACYVTYRLDYQIGNGNINILWKWTEKNEGRIYQLTQDLSTLAGKKVKFILTLLATGPSTGDRAMWGQPRIISTMTALLPIHDFNNFNVIGTMTCSEVANHTWWTNACNGESGGCWVSQTPLFGNSYAGFFRADGNTICGMNIP
jgi:Ig-like domain from next to BRCA1 gene